jgi:hypothetical protein
MLSAIVSLGYINGGPLYKFPSLLFTSFQVFSSILPSQNPKTPNLKPTNHHKPQWFTSAPTSAAVPP